jgi:hypothetical protein
MDELLNLPKRNLEIKVKTKYVPDNCFYLENTYSTISTPGVKNKILTENKCSSTGMIIKILKDAKSGTEYVLNEINNYSSSYTNYSNTGLNFFSRVKNSQFCENSKNECGEGEDNHNFTDKDLFTNNYFTKRK